MTFKPPLYRVFLRRAVLALLPLLCLASWGLYSSVQQQRQLDFEDMAYLLLERAHFVERQLEQALQVAMFAASRMRHAALREPMLCSGFLSDLVRIQPAVVGAAMRDDQGKTLCGSGAIPAEPLALAGLQAWRLALRPDGKLQLDQRVGLAGGGSPAQLSLQIDTEAVTGLGRSGGVGSGTEIRWSAEPAALAAVPARSVQFVSLRGQPVATVVATPTTSRSRSAVAFGLPAFATVLAACVLLTMAAMLWIGTRLLRGDSERLKRVARYPEEGESISTRMVAGELAEAAHVIAAEQLRAHQVGEELRQAKLGLEEVQRVASIGSWRFDVARGHTEWSAQACLIFGVPEGEPITLERLFSLAHPEDRASLTEHWLALIAGIADMDFALRIERTGGEERVVHVRGTAVARDDLGQATALVGTVQDVTEAWEATGLTDALASALALSGDPVLLTREHEGIWLWVWSNRAWDRLCEQLQLGGREADHQLFNPATGLLRAYVVPARDACAKRKALRLELAVAMALGQRWYEAELIPQLSAPGRAGHGLLVLRERTAERQAAQALRESNAQLERVVGERTDALARSEQQYRVLADLSPQILWQADCDGQVSYLNRAWHDLVGPRDDGWLGRRWLDALHPDDVTTSLEALDAGIRTRRPWHVRRRVKDMTGAYRSLLGVAAPVLGTGEQIESWIGVDTDITELERHAGRLQQLNAELETFSYTVSHDLRAPVHVIKGFVDALLSGQVGKLDDEARSYLERVLRSARRMDDLISDLLALARLSRETLQVQRIDPGELARGLVDAIQERYPDRVIECHTSGEGLEIEADRRLFQVLLENLLDNAAKFTAGRPVCRVELTWRRERDEIIIEMADNGVGFPEAYAHRLFRPYQRLHSNDEFPGNGIGLATVARIVQLHGGTISAHNLESGGAVFRVCMPLAVRPAAFGATTRART